MSGWKSGAVSGRCRKNDWARSVFFLAAHAPLACSEAVCCIAIKITHINTITILQYFVAYPYILQLWYLASPFVLERIICKKNIWTLDVSYDSYRKSHQMRPHQRDDWISFEDHTLSYSLAKDPSLWRVSKCLLKLLTDGAHTVSLSRLFHYKWFGHRESAAESPVLHVSWPTSRNGPLLLSYVEYSKKVLNLIDDSPWIISEYFDKVVSGVSVL